MDHDTALALMMALNATLTPIIPILGLVGLVFGLTRGGRR